MSIEPVNPKGDEGLSQFADIVIDEDTHIRDLYDVCGQALLNLLAADLAVRAQPNERWQVAKFQFVLRWLHLHPDQASCFLQPLISPCCAFEQISEEGRRHLLDLAEKYGVDFAVRRKLDCQPGKDEKPKKRSKKTKNKVAWIKQALTKDANILSLPSLTSSREVSTASRKSKSGQHITSWSLDTFVFHYSRVEMRELSQSDRLLFKLGPSPEGKEKKVSIRSGLGCFKGKSG